MFNRALAARRMAVIFDEWARRYADNPESFFEILDEEGQPITDYGKLAAEYFLRLGDELEAAGRLPTA